MRNLVSAVLVLLGSYAQAQPLEIFDTHLHYNSDARQQLSVAQVIQELDAANITRVLVSSTDDTGTQLLIAAEPKRFLPALRPYRQSGETKSWMYDLSVVEHLKTQLAKHTYVAMGEFHAFEEHINLPVVQEMIKLAQEHQLVLHHHGDFAAVEKLFAAWSDAKLLWAHAGFEEAETVNHALERYPSLWVDLSHRPDISTWAGLAPEWEELFKKHPTRFVLGSDTYSLERWKKLEFHTLDARDWLSVLPTDVAKNIAFRNAQRLFDP